MLWSFIAVCLSAWLSVDASYRGPTWQRWVFKPLTLLLLLLLAWQAPMFDAISYLVLAGLCATIAIELIQPIVGRSFDVDDILMNLFGTVISATLFFLLRAIFCPKRKQA